MIKGLLTSGKCWEKSPRSLSRLESDILRGWGISIISYSIYFKEIIGHYPRARLLINSIWKILNVCELKSPKRKLICSTYFGISIHQTLLDAGSTGLVVVEDPGGSLGPAVHIFMMKWFWWWWLTPYYFSNSFFSYKHTSKSHYYWETWTGTLGFQLKKALFIYKS